MPRKVGRGVLDIRPCFSSTSDSLHEILNLVEYTADRSIHVTLPRSTHFDRLHSIDLAVIHVVQQQPPGADLDESGGVGSLEMSHLWLPTRAWVGFLAGLVCSLMCHER
jgi:hypothetical protein